METKIENYSLMNKRVDATSSYWKKKYTLLLKRAENVEKQNLRLLNRLYQIKKISKRTSTEKRFLMKRLDTHNDGYKKVQFFQSSALCDVLHEIVNYTPQINTPSQTTTSKKAPSSSSSTTTSSTSKVVNKRRRTKRSASSGKQKYAGPKKPLNAFLWFCHEQREIVTRQIPGITHQELTKHMSKDWNTLNENDKEAYYDMFDKDKLRYEGELKEYKKLEESKNVSIPSKKVEKVPKSGGKLTNDGPASVEHGETTSEISEAVESLQEGNDMGT